MSLQQGKVVTLILLDRFGPVVSEVGKILFKNGPTYLKQVKTQSELSLAKIKEAICILIKYNLVSFKTTEAEGIGLYTLQTDNVLLMLRYPKYIKLIKTKFGEEAEILVEELLLKGSATASELILKTASRLKDNSDTSITLRHTKDKFDCLVNARYLQKRSTTPLPEEAETNLFALPNIDLKQLQQAHSGQQVAIEDSNGYWVANFDRFHQDLRDNLIVSAVTKKIDENTGELMRLLLQQMYVRTSPWQPISNPVPILEVKDLVKKLNTHQQLVAFFDQYLKMLEQDTNSFIVKVGEASGGSYEINMKQMLTTLAWEVVEETVLEKFDTKAARIFRLVKNKTYIEPEHIQQMVMIPSKEAKRLSYELLEENFLKLQELKKAVPNTGPAKSFTLFYIMLSQVVRTVIETCYKTICNIITRRHHNRTINKRIIDKKQRVDTITLGMRLQGATNEQLGDIEEMITPPEAEILATIGKVMKKLGVVEIELDDTIFLLQMYLAYE